MYTEPSTEFIVCTFGLVLRFLLWSGHSERPPPGVKQVLLGTKSRKQDDRGDAPYEEGDLHVYRAMEGRTSSKRLEWNHAGKG